MKNTIEIPKFSNEPLLDFSDRKVREKVSEEINRVRNNVLGKVYSHRVASVEEAKYFTGKRFTRENPARLDEIIGITCFSSEIGVDESINHITSINKKETQEWARMPVSERVYYIRKVASNIRQERLFFSALIMFEVGKRFIEADKEVREAIGLIEEYATYAPFLEKLNNLSLFNPDGEKNEAIHIPVGCIPICASIQPWNFPLAISAGPWAAAAVMGNSVIYKPAEQSSITGFYFADLVYRSGIPRTTLQFIPGYGEEIGAYLVSHPAVSLITFTGSKEVRQEIQKAIAHFNCNVLPTLPYGKYSEKRAAALESGGSNPIIVDSDANRDDVVKGVGGSAYGLAGQKCSACRRLIIVDPNGVRGKVYDEVITRLANHIESLPIGPPDDFKNLVGPLIDKAAYEKVLGYQELASEEGVVLAKGKVPSGLNGYFVPPMLVGSVKSESELYRKEIFGPLLLVDCVKSFDEAIPLANNTEFALTAGVFSNNPKNIEKAKRGLRAGNIYINRGITGAEVGRQPFGGFDMSGNSTKTGGLFYLLSFCNQQIITENTMHRGVPVA